jgi:hypothetical protein
MRSRAPGGAMRETEVDLDVLAQTESMFAVSNEYLDYQ